MADDGDGEGNSNDLGTLLVYCRWCSFPSCNHYVYHSDGVCPEREAFRLLTVDRAVMECEQHEH